MPYKSTYQAAFEFCAYGAIFFLSALITEKVLETESDIDYNSSRLDEIDEKIDELSSRIEKNHESSN